MPWPPPPSGGGGKVTSVHGATGIAATPVTGNVTVTLTKVKASALAAGTDIDITTVGGKAEISATVTPTVESVGGTAPIKATPRTGHVNVSWDPTAPVPFGTQTITDLAPGTAAGEAVTYTQLTASVETTVDLTILGTVFPYTVIHRLPTEPIIAVGDSRIFCGFLTGARAVEGLVFEGTSIVYLSDGIQVGYIQAAPTYLRLSQTFETIGVGFILTTGYIIVRAISGIYALPLLSATPGAIMQMGPSDTAEWVQRGAPVRTFTFTHTRATGDYTIYTWTNTTGGLVFISQEIAGHTTLSSPTWVAQLLITTTPVCTFTGTKPIRVTLTAVVAAGATVTLRVLNITSLGSGTHQPI